MPDYERFMRYVDTTSECWLWLGFRNPKGYGRFWYRGKKEHAQRVAWMFANGEIPQGMRVLHHCDNPPCVRPSHLFLGTPLDNMRDMIAKGRAKHPVRRGLRTWSKLTEDQVRQIRDLYTFAGVTQEQLAVRFGVSRRLIGGIVRGRRWLSLI